MVMLSQKKEMNVGNSKPKYKLYYIKTLSNLLVEIQNIKSHHGINHK